MHHSWLYCVSLGFGIAVGVTTGVIGLFYFLITLGEWLEDIWGVPAELVFVFGILTTVIGLFLTFACHGGN